MKLTYKDIIQQMRTVFTEYNKPPEKVVMNCPICGGEQTLVGARIKCNGHFRGKCEKCGCEFME